MPRSIHESIDRALAEVKSPRIVSIATGPNHHPVMKIDPKTRRATNDRQQFRLEADNTTLTILPKSEWIEYPDELVLEGGCRF